MPDPENADLAELWRRRSLTEDAARPEHGRLDVRRRRQHRDDDVGDRRGGGRAVGGSGAELAQLVQRRGVQVERGDGVVALEQVDRHQLAHRADADEPDERCGDDAQQRHRRNRNGGRLGSG